MVFEPRRQDSAGSVVQAKFLAQRKVQFVGVGDADALVPEGVDNLDSDIAEIVHELDFLIGKARALSQDFPFLVTKGVDDFYGDVTEGATASTDTSAIWAAAELPQARAPASSTAINRGVIFRIIVPLLFQMGWFGRSAISYHKQ